MASNRRSARSLVAVIATALIPAAVALAGAHARAETWVCTKRGDPTPQFSNAKKKGYRCVLYSTGQSFPKGSAAGGATSPPDGAAEDGGATEVAATGGSAEPAASGAAPAFERRQERFVPRLPTAGTSADEPPSRAGRESLYRPYIEEAAALYDIPEEFIKAIIRVESNFTYRAVSGAGAQGLMQLMPVTAREMGVSDVFDARQNILGGTRLLRTLANRYGGDIVQVLSAYCSGSGAVARRGGAVPSEDADRYVRAVLDFYYQYKSLEGP